MENLHLILTVGTGIGKAPTLLEGLVSTLNQLKPSRYWLVPSQSPDSIATADLLRDAAPAAFQPWSPTEPYRTIANPDDLHECRAALRAVIAAARHEHGRLVINPTSGTKQMSAGATLAALDEELGEIVFTVGDRAEGVVIAGTERMASFSTDRFFRERDLREADALYRSGAFSAAEALLRKWKGDTAIDRAILIARCAHEWHRLNYRAAAGAAARFDAPTHRHLDALARSVEQGPRSIRVVADIVASAEDLLAWGDGEESAVRSYQAYEYAARLRMEESGNLPSDYMGLREMMSTLDSICDPYAKAYRQTDMKRYLDIRNEWIHNLRPVKPSEATTLARLVRRALEQEYGEAALHPQLRRPPSLSP